MRGGGGGGKGGRGGGDGEDCNTLCASSEVSGRLVAQAPASFRFTRRLVPERDATPRNQVCTYTSTEIRMHYTPEHCNL